MTICLKNAKLCDARLWNVKADVLIEDGVIRDVGVGLAGDESYDLAGCTLLPGLIDAHIHMVSGGEDFDDASLKSWAQAGVLAVRDLGLGNGESADRYLAWLRTTAKPENALVVTAGQPVAAWGGYMHRMMGKENGIGVKTPADAEAAIETQIQKGCHGVKIAMDYDMLDENTPQYTPETVRAIAAKARALGVWCTAHVQMAKFLRILVENGIPEMAHTVLDPIPDDLLDEMVARDIPICSTLQPINVPRPPLPKEELDRMPPHMRETIAKIEAIDTAQQEKDAVDNIRRFHQKGGTVVMGTDTMRMTQQPGNARIPLRELHLLRQAGLSVQEVIDACTKNAARACGLTDMGSITPGKAACLIAVPGELTEVDALENVRFVMNRGVIIRNDITN